VRRWCHMSVLGARENAVTRYQQTKWHGEQAVRAGGMIWTIFRPSMVHGPGCELMRLMHRLWCRPMPPFVPCFTGRRGSGRIQPVWVQDVAHCVVQSLTNPRSEYEVYPLCGPDIYTWPQFYDLCRRHLPCARAKRVVSVPAALANLAAALPGMPFTDEQIIMAMEDAVCSPAKAEADFELEFSGFEATFHQYAAEVA
jgi:uncharacterized protein YbjT (DUF2867 family)